MDERDRRRALEKFNLLLKKIEGNNNEEEARTSSYLAVKLLLKYKFTVSVSGEDAEGGIDFASLLEELERRARGRQPPVSDRGERIRRNRQGGPFSSPFYSSPFRYEPPPHPEPEEPPPPPPPPQSKNRGRIHYEVFTGNAYTLGLCCKYCGTNFVPGEAIYKAQPGANLIHKECVLGYEAMYEG